MTTQPPSLSDRILTELTGQPPTLSLPWLTGDSQPLWRLDDDEYDLLQRRSLAIKDDYWFLMQLGSCRQGEDRLSLAKTFATLTKLAGRSSKRLDTYKQSFRFPFLHGPAGKPPTLYLLTVQDIRGSLYFSSRRVVDSEDPRLSQHLLHEPFDSEYSRDELNRLAATMYGFLQGYAECVVPQPFVQTVKSDLIVYGHAGSADFEERHDNPAAYEFAIKQWSRRIATSEECARPTIVTRLGQSKQY